MQFELRHTSIKFHPDQMKSERENEPNKFYFALILRPPGKVKVSESGIKVAEFNGTYKHGRYEQNLRNSLHVMSNVKVLPRKTAGRTNEHDTLHRSVWYSYWSNMGFVSPLCS